MHAAGGAEHSTQVWKAPEWTVVWGWGLGNKGGEAPGEAGAVGGRQERALWVLDGHAEEGHVESSTTLFAFRIRHVGKSRECERTRRVRGGRWAVGTENLFRDCSSLGERCRWPEMRGGNRGL